MTADLSSLSQVRRLAAEILAQRDRLDVLVNNAGVITPRRQLTADGLETTFATNHLGPFLLTSLLPDPLEPSPPARGWPVSPALPNQARPAPWPGTTRRPRGCGGSGRISLALPTAASPATDSPLSTGHRWLVDAGGNSGRQGFSGKGENWCKL